MPGFSLELPADFADYEWEVEAKGWFSQARINASGKRYLLNFYDPARLAQAINDELERGRVFFEPNLVIVQSITRTSMEQAVALLMESGELTNMVEE
ncbi:MULTISPECIES: hypothetical protein [unclassified Bradyrhizobium]|uniref:hypothetical protein n=1 Tax=unclassified Bradyrhizobium TaxID=2631580 RepID=UPI001BA6D510|nr:MULTISPECIES: hypothetical protein [unclassified Bradyrhizobium]MBR1208674.1 hypothetical protein [Bradyrhizobium sp. AUGA SZCCT0124]MBR1315306.1 hypothetical protein [Bradyrhizobium sp. AUGA SZCCT0051]MBR1344203.1 hypothetical protein [Bradyrhizobium sp. AUGA SZCCT0105]MBR1357810.1 hypothetical protein [Bradyrhizobium sp. AUGA SZCCT0045]